MEWRPKKEWIFLFSFHSFIMIIWRMPENLTRRKEIENSDDFDTFVMSKRECKILAENFAHSVASTHTHTHVFGIQFFYSYLSFTSFSWRCGWWRRWQWLHGNCPTFCSSSLSYRLLMLLLMVASCYCYCCISHFCWFPCCVLCFSFPILTNGN